MKANHNKWKIAFFTLSIVVAIILVLLVFLMQRLFPEIDDHTYLPKQETREEATFFIQTDKQRLNQLIAKQIEKEPSDIPFVVELLHEDVQFRSTFSILGQNVPITVNFKPAVEQNGDLVLEVDSFSLGLFQLPVDRMLQLMKEVLDLEEWIVIHPHERMVEVNVTEIEVDAEQSMYFRFATFDLINDNIELEVVFR